MRVDRSNSDNAFRWNKIRLNFPGEKCPPTISLMSKLQGGTQYMSSEFTPYLHDSSASAEEACRAYRRVGSTWQYLVLQYYTFKRRMLGTYGCPWRVMKVHIIDGSIYQLIGKV